MSMRTYGEIGDVIYRCQGYDIYNHAMKYKLSIDGEIKYAYANTMAELREEIKKSTGDQDGQQYNYGN